MFIFILLLFGLFISGSNAVSLIGSTLDFNRGQLILSFDGVINNTAADCSAIQIASNDVSLLLIIPLTDSKLSFSSVDTELICDLGTDKVTLLETPGIATDGNDTFVIALNSGINDSSGLPANVSAVLSSLPIPDTTRPSLLSSVLFDLNTGNLVLSFDDYIYPSALNFTDLILQSDFSIDYTDSQLFHRLSGGTCTLQCESSDTLYIGLTTSDLNQIKLRTLLCTSRTDCVPTFSSLFVEDYSGNPVSSANGQISVTERSLIIFIQDFIPPVLISFDIDLERDTLTLLFTEPVDAIDSLNVNAISLQGSEFPFSDSVTLSNSTSEDTYVIELTLNLNSDKQLIKDSLFFNSENDTFLSLGSDAIRDVGGNLATPIPSFFPLQVSNYIRDETPPLIDSYELNLANSSITFLFSESILVSSLIPFTDTFLLNNITGGVNITLGGTIQGGPFTPNTEATSATLLLDALSVTLIKSNDMIGNDPTDTLLQVLRGAFQDRNDLYNLADTVDNVTIVDDVILPSLISFGLDMDSGVLMLTFDEVITSSSVASSSIIIQNDAANATLERQLTGGSSTSLSDYIVSLELNEDDLTYLKAAVGLADSAISTYLSISSDKVSDTMGQQVSIYTPDVTQPILQSLTLDMDSGTLDLTFDEPVMVESVNVSQITISNSTLSPRAEVVLSAPETITPSSSQRVITLTLNTDDINNIKQIRNLATLTSNTILNISSNTFLDTNYNGITETQLSPAQLISDTTGPYLENFLSFDLNTGIFTLSFDEPVIESSVDFTAISFQNDFTVDRSDPNNFYSLTTGTVLSAASTPEVTFLLFEYDLNQIKLREGLCERLTDCVPTIGSAFITDRATIPNPINPVTNTGVYLAQRGLHIYIPDTTSPLLVSFTLDLIIGQLLLTFSEPVDGASLNSSLITIQDRVSNPSVAVAMTGATTADIRAIEITLELGDIARTLRNSGFMTNNTFLSLSSGAIVDVSGNPVIAIFSTSPLQATAVYADTTPPNITSFSLDLGSNQLLINFSEAIRASEAQSSLFSLQNTSNSSDTPVVIALTESSFVDENNNPIGDGVISARLSMSQNAIELLKTDATIGTQQSNTYLRTETNAFIDMSEIPNAAAVTQASMVLLDDTPSQLLSFSLDMNIGRLDFTFDDVVSSESVSFPSFTIQDGMTGSQMVQLTGGSSASTSGFLFSLSLTLADLNNIKLDPNLATDISNTYITMSADALNSISGTEVAPITDGNALPVASYIPDTTAPVLLDFSFDLNVGSLNLTFNEPLSYSSPNIGAFTLQNLASNPTESVTLTAPPKSIHSSEDRTDFGVFITDSDLDRIKLSLNLGTQLSNTFIVFDSGAVSDTSNLPINAFTEGFQALFYVPDFTSPSFTQFTSFDLTSGTIIFSFDEPVDAYSILLPSITFLNSMTNATQTYTLQNSVCNSSAGCVSGRQLSFTLSSEDLTAIKQLDNLCTSLFNCYATNDPYFVQDLNANPIVDTFTHQVQTLLQTIQPLAESCNAPLLQKYSSIHTFVERILASPLSAVVGPDDLPLLNEDSYFLEESPNGVTTVLELNTPSSDLQGSFWVTGVAILQRPATSDAATHSCATVEPLDTQLFQLQYSKNGVRNHFEYVNAPLGLYSFEGILAAEEAVIKVAVIPTVVDSVQISKYFPGVARFCLQFELYGCEATQSLIHPDILQYNMPLPNAESGPLNQYTFSDLSYTGVCSNRVCTGGVGLLTDGFIESAAYTAYSRFTGWEGSSSYSVQLYLNSVYTINELIVYGSEWLAPPVDSKAPNDITVNGQQFKVSTTPTGNQANLSYFGTGVYFISVPVVTTSGVLDITFQGSSYYSLLLSEVVLVAELGGSVKLRERVYYPNGTNKALEARFIFGGNQTLNQTSPTLPPLTTNTPPTLVGNSTLSPAVELILPLSLTVAVLSVVSLGLLVLSMLLCCALILRNKPRKRRALSVIPVIDDIHSSPSVPVHPDYFANPLIDNTAYDTRTTFVDSHIQS